MSVQNVLDFAASQILDCWLGDQFKHTRWGQKEGELSVSLGRESRLSLGRWKVNWCLNGVGKDALFTFISSLQPTPS